MYYAANISEWQFASKWVNLSWDDDIKRQPQDAPTFCPCFIKPDFCSFYLASTIL